MGAYDYSGSLRIGNWSSSWYTGTGRKTAWPHFWLKFNNNQTLEAQLTNYGHSTVVVGAQRPRFLTLFSCGSPKCQVKDGSSLGNDLVIAWGLSSGSCWCAWIRPQSLPGGNKASLCLSVGFFLWCLFCVTFQEEVILKESFRMKPENSLSTFLLSRQSAYKWLRGRWKGGFLIGQQSSSWVNVSFDLRGDSLTRKSLRIIYSKL